MRTSTNRARRVRRLTIFNVLILSVSLLASQTAFMAQSRAGAGSLTNAKPTSVKPAGRDSANAETRSKDRASLTSENAECFQKMAEETAAYIEKARIPIKAAKGEYFADKGVAAFLLSSEEKLNVSDPKAGGRKVVSVINYKAGEANSVFFVIEAETKENAVVYSVKRDERVLKTFAANVKRSRAIKGPGVDPCTQINQDNAAYLASLQADANQTCQTRSTCIGYCSNFGNTIAWTIVIVKPNNWKCPIEISAAQSLYDFTWLVAVEELVPHEPLFDWTIWKAVKNDAALFN